MKCSVGFLVCLVANINLLHVCQCDYRTKETQSDELWDYVKVRDDAYMFWWLYYTTAAEGHQTKPLVMWLQGGPGGSSTGFGNFKEIGPLDVSLQPRNTTWLSEVSLLFVDNPVGTGYSYVTDDTAYAKNDHDIAVDLVTTMRTFLKKLPNFQTVPFYIFSESYGGKMTAAFAQELYNAIQNKDIVCNFKGFAMGDSWISPVDSVLTWAPYLYSTSLIDEPGFDVVNKTAQDCQKAVLQGNWTLATSLWSELEDVVEVVTDGVNWYNILKWGSELQRKVKGRKDILGRQYERHVGVYQNDALSELMNGPIRKKLKIIPKNVTWGSQSEGVFQNLRADFMKDVVGIVSSLLKTPLKVVVYSGQLDLIVDTIGTDLWVNRLDWNGLKEYVKSPRKAWYSGGAGKNMAGYIKSYSNFSFYWVLGAGHMVPADAGDAAQQLLQMVTSSGL